MLRWFGPGGPEGNWGRSPGQAIELAVDEAVRGAGQQWKEPDDEVVALKRGAWSNRPSRPWVAPVLAPNPHPGPVPGPNGHGSVEVPAQRDYPIGDNRIKHVLLAGRDAVAGGDVAPGA